VNPRRLLSVVAGISLVYDLVTGLALLLSTDSIASWFGARVPDPVLFAKLNGLFLIAVGLGYLQPLRDPDAHRAYLWIFGPFLKGAGAVAFVVDHYANGSPPSFLLFAVTDGGLALVTLVALLRRRDDPPSVAFARTASRPEIPPG
jgi:hypothetical protein